MPILRDPPVFEGLICAIAEKIQNHYPDVELIAGIESRGFLFGPSVAVKLGVGFIPVRKRGKLPGKVVQMSYEYDFGPVRQHSYFVRLLCIQRHDINTHGACNVMT